MQQSSQTHFYEEFIGPHPLMRLLYGKPREVKIHSNGNNQIESHIFFAGDRFIIEEFTRTDAKVTGWALYVLKAGSPGDALQKIRNVYPGAIVLLDAVGKRNVEKILGWLEEVSNHTRPELIDDEVYLLADFRMKAEKKLDAMRNLVRVK